MMRNFERYTTCCIGWIMNQENAFEPTTATAKAAPFEAVSYNYNTRGTSPSFVIGHKLFPTSFLPIVSTSHNSWPPLHCTLPMASCERRLAENILFLLCFYPLEMLRWRRKGKIPSSLYEEEEGVQVLVCPGINRAAGDPSKGG